MAQQVRPVPVPLLLNDKADRRFVERLLMPIGAAAGVNWAPTYVPLRRLLLAAERGQAFSFGIGRTAERERTLAFSDPVLYGYAWLIKRRDSALAFRSLADLKGRVVCAVSGSSLSAEFDAAKGVLFTTVDVASGLDRGVAMLRARRCDVLAFTTHIGPSHRALEAYMRAEDRSNDDLAVLPKPLAIRPACLAVRKDDPLAALLPGINRALAARRSAGH